MKRTVKVKNLIAFAAVLILLFSITAIPAYADFPPLTTAGRRFGSWLLATLTAANITLTSSVAASQGADIINFLADPLDVNYSYTEMWNDRPTIQIWDDYTTIDGVTYTDVWLSNEAASKFKTDGMDFATAYSIASNTNGTFASGEGYVEGLPVFLVNNQLVSQSTKIPSDIGTYAFGNSRITNTPYTDTSNTLNWVGSNQSPIAGFTLNKAAYPVEFKFRSFSQDMQYALFQGIHKVDGGNWTNDTVVQSKVIQPFDFDWVAGTIDSTPLGPNEGLMLRMPSNTVTELKDFLTDNPEFGQPGGTTIDVNIDPDIMTKLDDLIDIIAPIIPIINNIGDVNFTVNHTEPQPQPQPEPAPDVDPETPVSDITYNDYYQTITNQTEYINNTVENIDNSIQNLDNHIDNIVENQDTIIENQDTIIQESIPEIIENIPKIDEICNNIDTAPYHDLDTGLDHLPSFFLPFITDLRSALGIWHYVTEWLAQISTTFAFVTGCLVGTSIMTPIYAAIAGFMCIKIYRRMTA